MGPQDKDETIENSLETAFGVKLKPFKKKNPRVFYFNYLRTLVAIFCAGKWYTVIIII